MHFRNSIAAGGTKTKLDMIHNDWKQHLEEATSRRIIYKQDITVIAKDPNVVVISFDYKQNIALPSCTWQSNILYYKRKWNINVFNIVDEAKDQHHIFLYDERQGTKSANEIASMLSSFLKSYINRNFHLICYCDNCGGQNKNQHLISFFALLVAVGFFASVRLKFMTVGHTHFNPDRGFAWIQRCNKMKDLYTVQDVLTACKEASPKISPQIFNDMHNWITYLEPLHGAIKGIKNVAEVCISGDGKIYMSETLLPSSVRPDVSKYSITYPKKGNFLKLSTPKLVKYSKNSVPSLPPSDFKKEKKEDLRKIFESGVVPSQYKQYYVLYSYVNCGCVFNFLPLNLDNV